MFQMIRRDGVELSSELRAARKRKLIGMDSQAQSMAARRRKYLP